MKTARIFSKFSGYILIKWVCFYLYQFLESRNSWNWEKVNSREDALFTAWMLLALPILEILILIFPFQLALKQKGIIALFILLLTFSFEFAIGWYATNQRFATWMIIKLFFSVALFYIFYKKEIWING
ncbi:hypothetical protein HNQ92_001077 [Rhabdobacter roseus]|uniref:Uncharacterized protein n=1 Tax=Rhabdobacter roseus TaxID=1655419 RepID=A0A840TI25_9BACT|nr:hypothetical protein [Rhabdobacter roseus]MBB5282951.1 hypothetical protein [Rhabdobacter roseus]